MPKMPKKDPKNFAKELEKHMKKKFLPLLEFRHFKYLGNLGNYFNFRQFRHFKL